jgi:hypothetical protein
VKPLLDTSWEALKDKRKIPNGLYLFSKIDPPEVVAHYRITQKTGGKRHRAATVRYFSQRRERKRSK